MEPTRRQPLIDAEPARRAFDDWVAQVNARRYSKAIEPRRRLEALGVVVLHRPGRSLAAREAERRGGVAT